MYRRTNEGVKGEIFPKGDSRIPVINLKVNRLLSDFPGLHEVGSRRVEDDGNVGVIFFAKGPAGILFDLAMTHPKLTEILEFVPTLK